MQQAFVELCGKWETVDGTETIKVVRNLDGDGWEANVSGSTPLIILCVINDDGTVTLNATANYSLFKKYSYYATPDADTFSREFSYTGKTLPDDKIENSSDIGGYTGLSWLTLEKGNFKFASAVAASTFTSSSECTYTNLVEAY